MVLGIYREFSNLTIFIWFSLNRHLFFLNFPVSAKPVTFFLFVQALVTFIFLRIHLINAVYLKKFLNLICKNNFFWLTLVWDVSVHCCFWVQLIVPQFNWIWLIPSYASLRLLFFLALNSDLYWQNSQNSNSCWQFWKFYIQSGWPTELYTMYMHIWCDTENCPRQYSQ